MSRCQDNERLFKLDKFDHEPTLDEDSRASLDSSDEDTRTDSNNEAEYTNEEDDDWEFELDGFSRTKYSSVTSHIYHGVYDVDDIVW